MELLGPSVWDVWNTEGQTLPVPYVACVATEALRALQDLHNRGYGHPAFAVALYNVDYSVAHGCCLHRWQY